MDSMQTTACHICGGLFLKHFMYFESGEIPSFPPTCARCQPVAQPKVKVRDEHIEKASQIIKVIDGYDTDAYKLILAATLIAQFESSLRTQLEAEGDVVRQLSKALNPFTWTKEMSDAWHNALPDVQKAFNELHLAAVKPLSTQPTQDKGD